jgi:protein-S-isoprenylcysteine O-methyltransferase Ste14
MYGSLLFLVIGALLKHVTPVTLILTIIALVFLLLTAKIEEKENIKFFGSAYEDYMDRTKMFVPFIF